MKLSNITNSIQFIHLVLLEVVLVVLSLVLIVASLCMFSHGYQFGITNFVGMILFYIGGFCTFVAYQFGKHLVKTYKDNKH